MSRFIWYFAVFVLLATNTISSFIESGRLSENVENRFHFEFLEGSNDNYAVLKISYVTEENSSLESPVLNITSLINGQYALLNNTKDNDIGKESCHIVDDYFIDFSGDSPCILYGKINTVPESHIKYDLSYGDGSDGSFTDLSLSASHLIHSFNKYYLNSKGISIFLTNSNVKQEQDDLPYVTATLNVNMTGFIDFNFFAKHANHDQQQVTFSEFNIHLPTDYVVTLRNCKSTDFSARGFSHDSEYIKISSLKLNSQSKNELTCDIKLKYKTININNNNYLSSKENLNDFENNLVFELNMKSSALSLEYKVPVKYAYVTEVIDTKLTFKSSLTSDNDKPFYYISFEGLKDTLILEGLGFDSDCFTLNTFPQYIQLQVKTGNSELLESEGCFVSSTTTIEGKGLFAHPFTISYLNPSPHNVFYVHNLPILKTEDITFQILKKDDSTFSLQGIVSPLFRYCFNIPEISLIVSNLYSIEKSTQSKHLTCPDGSIIFTFSKLQYRIEFGTHFSLDEGQIINTTVSVLPLLYEGGVSNTDFYKHLGDVQISINPYISNPYNFFEKLNSDTHSGSIKVVVSHPDKNTEILLPLLSKIVQLKKCTIKTYFDNNTDLSEDFKIDVSTKIFKEVEVLSISPLFTIDKSPQTSTLTCEVDVNPKLIEDHIYSNGVKLIRSQNVLNEYDLTINGNPKAIAREEKVLYTVNWTRTNKLINSQIKRAKDLIITALDVDPSTIHLLDLSLFDKNITDNKPFIQGYDTSSLFNSLSTSTYNSGVSATFAGDMGDNFKLEDIQNALDTVINDPNNNFNDMSTSAVIDQIFSECIAAGYGCGDLCAPCTGNDPCKSDFDCFSGVCSFGLCADFDSQSGNSSSFNQINLGLYLVISVFVLFNYFV